MASEGLKIKYLDASALVKLYIEKEEKGIQHLRDFFNSTTNFTTTWLCLAEAIGVFKRDYQRKKIELEEKYLKALLSLIIEWRNRIESDDIKSDDPTIPIQVSKIMEKYKLDYSDALQLWSIKYGRLSPSVVFENKFIESALVLITADKDLARAAESERIKVWNCEDGPAPEWAY
jgi:predicted nucleic acid-binding protein